MPVVYVMKIRVPSLLNYLLQMLKLHFVMVIPLQKSVDIELQNLHFIFFLNNQ